MKVKIMGKKLKDFVKYLEKNYFSEGIFEFDKDGLKFIGLSSDSIFLVDYKIEASEFIEYSVEEKEEIGVNIEVLNKILKNFSNDEITLKTENNNLYIEQKNKKSSIALVDLAKTEIPNIKEIQGTVIEIEKKKIKDALKKILALKSDRVELIVNGSFKVSCKTNLATYSETLKEQVLGEETKVVIRSQYLVNLVDIPEAETIKLILANEQPLEIETENAKCYIAPILE